jgi:hypothetical protein
VETIPRVFETPVPAGERVFLWNDVIRLHNYAVSQTASNLELTLHWQALRRMEASYKVFVHLRDPASGEIVAQADRVPREWGYPTRWWEEGEFVEDTVRLDLQGVPPGTYDLFLGLYDEATGIRLPARNQAGDAFQDDSVPLLAGEAGVAIGD